MKGGNLAVSSFLKVSFILFVGMYKLCRGISNVFRLSSLGLNHKEIVLLSSHISIEVYCV